MSDAVVLQASGADAELAWSAWSSAKNLLAELPGTTVEVVVQGGAVTGLLSHHPTAARLAEARTDLPTVTILACANALRAHHVDPAQLGAGIRVVPAGIAHLVSRQREGWAYVRVG